MRICLILILLLTACGRSPTIVQSPAEEKALPPIIAKSEVDKAKATTGETIRFTVTVNAHSDLQVELPEAGSNIAGFRIVNFGSDEQRQTEKIVPGCFRGDFDRYVVRRVGADMEVCAIGVA